MKRSRIINWFPKPENLTELSVLSVYEVAIYLFLFVLFVWLYFSFTSVQVKSITINSERIDSLPIDSLISYDKDWKLVKQIKPRYISRDVCIDESQQAASQNFVADSTIAKSYENIYFNIPLSTAVSDDTVSEPNVLCDFGFELHNDSLNIKNNCFNWVRNLYKKDELDSLLAEYNSACPEGVEHDYGTVHYQKILTSQDNAPRFGTMQSRDKVYVRDNRYCGRHKFQFKQKGTSMELVDEDYKRCGFGSVINEKGFVLSKPHILDLYDISQCYYKIKVESSTIDSINLNIHFEGANDFIFVNEEPTEVNCQNVNYKIIQRLNPDGTYPNLGIDKEIILHVKSREFENKQNSRMFFITAVLSGLIVLFIAFLIIFFYRFYGWVMMKRQGESSPQQET